MATDADFELNINTDPLNELDEFALLACQDYNFGNSTGWFGTFRGGLYGIYSRVYGVKVHYRDVHSWILKVRHLIETEYHVSSILFGMDSAIECFTFMLNALGYAAVPTGFRDVTDARMLGRVAPRDVLGNPRASRPIAPIPGYRLLFPNLQAYWKANQTLLATIMEQHDVSKHRQTVLSGGKARLDAPPGFYEYFGAQSDTTKQVFLWPQAEIILRRDPKELQVNRTPTTYEDRLLLETVVEDFCSFINQSCILALDDAQTNIHLQFDEFQRS